MCGYSLIELLFSLFLLTCMIIVMNTFYLHDQNRIEFALDWVNGCNQVINLSALLDNSILTSQPQILNKWRHETHQLLPHIQAKITKPHADEFLLHLSSQLPCAEIFSLDQDLCVSESIR